MDTNIRLVAKSITWQIMGLCVMTLIGYFFTGSFSAGGAMAIIGAVTGFIGFIIHETVWSRIGWGRN
ncbi:MAG: hypothetical protein C0605_13235 [Hyphomicrobiales bacterium]|nr:MAG: hypothetical protein C0605_13235 [Hyphomicrobiales bacterium]